MTQRNLKKTVRSMAIAALAMIVLTSTAVPADACEFLNNLCPWNWGRNNECVATTYAPPFTSAIAPTMASYSTPSSYAVARTACYMPQTCYRTVYRTTPVTTYQMVNRCDPCTGTPVTTFRPIVGYRRVAQLVPYTTYRVAWQNNLSYATYYNPCSTGYSPCTTGCYSSGCYSGACGTSACGTGTYGTGTYGTGVTTSGCSSCTSTPATTIISQPTTAQPTYSNGSQQPTLSPGSGTTWGTKRPTETKVIKPTPEPEPTTSQSYQSKPFQVPQLVPAGRTASTPVRLVSYQSYSSPQSMAPVSQPTSMNNVVDDTNEWQAR